MAAKVEGGRRGDIWFIGPTGIGLIGVDYGDATHPLYNQERVPEMRPDHPEVIKMVESIESHGRVLVPCKVRKNPQFPKSKYEWECIWGNTRIFAARIVNERRKKLGLDPIEIPFTIEKGADDSLLIAMMTTENEIRREVSVYGKAQLAKKLFDSTNGDVKRVAAQFGVIPSTISDWLLMLESGPDALRALKDGRIPARQAILLAKLPLDERKDMLDQILSGTAEGLSVSTDAVRRAVSESREAALAEQAAPEGKTKAPRAAKEGAEPTPATGGTSLSGELPKRVLAKIVDPDADVELSPKFLAVARAMTEEEYDAAVAKTLGDDVYKAIRAIKGFAGPTTVAGLAGAIKTVTTKKAKGTTVVHVVEANKKLASA